MVAAPRGAASAHRLAPSELRQAVGAVNVAGGLAIVLQVLLRV